jgi:hypothetical protein
MLAGDYLSEITSPDKPVFPVRWTSYPTNIMMTIIFLTTFSHFWVKELHAIIVYEYGCSSALQLVS